MSVSCNRCDSDETTLCIGKDKSNNIVVCKGQQNIATKGDVKAKGAKDITNLVDASVLGEVGTAPIQLVKVF